MAQSPPPPQGLPGLDHWVFAQGWGWAPQHSDSTSPASSSSDSSGSCPCYIPRCPTQSAGLARGTSKAQAAPTAAPRRARPAPAGGQRQSASEREKLRMRTLARALHELRRFLPPSVAPAGQSLTKIETLRLAIRYIGHLSAVLGLSEDSLQSRRRRSADTASSHRCPLCPDGGPSPAPMLAPGLGSAISGGVPWGSPPACPGPRVSPENLGSRISNVDPWVTPPYCPQIQSPLNQPLGRAPDTSQWTPPQACSGVQTSPEPRNKAGPWSPSTAPEELTQVYQVGPRFSNEGEDERSLIGSCRGRDEALASSDHRHGYRDGCATASTAWGREDDGPRVYTGARVEGCFRVSRTLPVPGKPTPPARPFMPETSASTSVGLLGHSAEVLSSSDDQGSSPAFQLPPASPIPSSGLQLSGCPELWQEDLGGPPLNIFY